MFHLNARYKSLSLCYILLPAVSHSFQESYVLATSSSQQPLSSYKLLFGPSPASPEVLLVQAVKKSPYDPDGRQ
jgi:hypothetical protein